MGGQGSGWQRTKKLTVEEGLILHAELDSDPDDRACDVAAATLDALQGGLRRVVSQRVYVDRYEWARLEKDAVPASQRESHFRIAKRQLRDQSRDLGRLRGIGF